MRSFQKPARRGLILALPLSLLAACGGGDDVAGATSGAGPSAATLAAAVPADASQEALPEAVEATYSALVWWDGQHFVTRPLDERSLPSVTVWCVTPGRRLLPARTRAFMEMLRDSLAPT